MLDEREDEQPGHRGDRADGGWPDVEPGQLWPEPGHAGQDAWAFGAAPPSRTVAANAAAFERLSDAQRSLDGNMLTLSRVPEHTGPSTFIIKPWTQSRPGQGTRIPKSRLDGAAIRKILG